MTRKTEELVEQLWQRIWIDGDVDELSDLLTDPFVRHTRDGTRTMSLADYARHITSVVGSLRGTEVRFDHLASVDDHVYARLTLLGFNLATEKPMHVTWLAQYRIAEDRIAEAWTMHQTDLDW